MTTYVFDVNAVIENLRDSIKSRIESTTAEFMTKAVEDLRAELRTACAKFTGDIAIYLADQDPKSIYRYLRVELKMNEKTE